MLRFIVPASLFLLAGALPADAKDLKILTGAGMFMPVRALAADYGSRTSNTVTVVSDTAGNEIASDGTNVYLVGGGHCTIIA